MSQNKIDWNEKCHYDVKREIAGQHSRCGTCKYFCFLVEGFPKPCRFSWSDRPDLKGEQ